jgi:hypothetical protein
VPLLLSSPYTKYPLVPPASQPSYRTRTKLLRPSGLTAAVKETSMRLVQGDVSAATSCLNSCLQIDVVEASAASGLERADLTKQISDWELDGQASLFLCGCWWLYRCHRRHHIKGFTNSSREWLAAPVCSVHSSIVAALHGLEGATSDSRSHKTGGRRYVSTYAEA